MPMITVIRCVTAVVKKTNVPLKMLLSSTAGFDNLGKLFNSYNKPHSCRQVISHMLQTGTQINLLLYILYVKLPFFEPVGRERELQLVLKNSLDNWKEQRKMNKSKILYASQSQGSGKTFLVQYLRHFMDKDMKSSDSVVKKLMDSPMYSHLNKHLTALSTTRSIIIPVGRLSTKCTSLEEAVVVEVVSQLSGEYVNEVLKEVRARGLKFPQLCDELLTQNPALIIILDDMPDLALSERPENLAWLHSVAPHIDTREQKTLAAMTLFKNLVESVLDKPGALLYMTGRGADATYQLLGTVKSSSLIAQPVWLDSLQQEHIEEMLTLTCIASTEVKFYDYMGLRNLEEVRELAQWALFHTGGVPRVLAGAFDAVRYGEFLKPGRRAAEQSVWDALSSPKVSRQIYRRAKDFVYHGFGPNVWELNYMIGWDPAISTVSLLQVLEAARDNTPVQCSLQVKVAEGQHVTAVDLLSVLGVPFKLTDSDTLKVQLSAWWIRTLLTHKTVDWTESEVRQQIQWMCELTDDGNVDLNQLGLSDLL